jgi:putative component of toxin-antitoxin plasmid stabilization module
VIELRYYLAGDGKSPFEDWFSGLNAAAAVKVAVAVALARLEQGNLSNAKGLGKGFWNTGSTGGLVIGSISGAMATFW